VTEEDLDRAVEILDASLTAVATVGD
jgi:hypothetical protein